MAAGILSRSSRHFRTLKLIQPQRFPTVPSFSSQSQSEKQLSLSNLLQRYGFSPPRIPDFLHKNRRFGLGLRLREVEQSLGILSSSLQIPKEYLVSMVSECPGVLELDFIKKWETVFCELGLSCDVSRVGVANVIKLSRRLGMEPDGFVRNFEALKGLGVSDATICRILEEFPRAIVTVAESGVCDKVVFLEGIGIRGNGIDWVLEVFPGILELHTEGRLKPLINEFRHLGFGDDLVRKEIIKEPRILSMELGELSRCVDLLWSLRCREAVKQAIFEKGEFRAGFEVKLRVDCLRKYGLIRRDAFGVLLREPRVILYEIEEIERKIEFLLSKMKYGIESLVDVPEYLGANFEKQILPRYNVIEYLGARGGLGDPVYLRDLIKLSRLRFYNLYVKPYPECEKLYGRFSVAKVKSVHPVGLWKLLKPKKSPASEDDVRNMRSFMESLG